MYGGAVSYLGVIFFGASDQKIEAGKGWLLEFELEAGLAA